MQMTRFKQSNFGTNNFNFRETIGDGTWKKVTLDNGQHYYFNTKTKASIWTVPPEVQAILDEQEREKEKEKENNKENDNDNEDADIEERVAKKLKTENGYDFNKIITKIKYKL